MKTILSFLLLSTSVLYAQNAVIKNAESLYLYETATQNANRTKINKKIGDNIEVSDCDRYGWCKSGDGFIKKIFITVSAGYSSSKVKQTDEVGTITLAKPIDTKGYNLGVGVGYNYNERVFFTANYQKKYFDDVHVDNLFLSVNYRFEKIEEFYPYGGVLAGYSQMSWTTDPISSLISDVSSGSYLVGAVIGLTYPINERLTLDVNYQLHHTNHKTHLISSPAKSTLVHSLSHNFNLGLRWSF